MSALENSALEETRERIGAIVLLTQNSNGANYLKFVETNTTSGALDLIRDDYARIEKENYILTDKGWKYAIETLESIGKII